MLILIVVSNLYPFTTIIKKIFDERHFRYSTFDGGSTFFEIKQRDFRMAKLQFKQCVEANPGISDKNMYRLFKINPFAFWRWGDYIFNERYRLPYKSWSEIEDFRRSRATVNCSKDF